MSLFLKGEILRKNKLLYSRLYISYKNVGIETRLLHNNNVVSNKNKEIPSSVTEIPNDPANDSHITFKKDSLLTDENESILIRANNSAVSKNVYMNCEKDNVYYFVNLIDNRWITETEKIKKDLKGNIGKKILSFFDNLKVLM